LRPEPFGLHNRAMTFELVAILEKLRALYSIPRGPDRFGAYIDLAVGGARTSAEVALPPLVTVNPMAKGHALEFVDSWISLGAEETAATALEEANVRLGSVEYARRVRVGLSVLDDRMGGWTNRTFNDAARFNVAALLEKTGWVCVPLWTSEIPNLEDLRSVVLEATFRAAFVVRHGDPKTLREMIHQEGLAAAFAGRSLEFDREELEYSRAVIAPFLEGTHQPTVIACLYGDEAARELGYAPLGLSKNAGFQVGLADALQADAIRADA
jgi:hypothetical protein